MALELKLVDIAALAEAAPSTPVSLLPYIEALTSLRAAGEGKAYALTCSDKTGAKQAKRALIRAGRALSPASGVKFSKLAPVAGDASGKLELGFWLAGDPKPARARKTSAERKAAREAKAAAKLAQTNAGASGEVTHAGDAPATGEGAPANAPSNETPDPAPDAPAGEVGNAGDIAPANAPSNETPAGKRK